MQNGSLVKVKSVAFSPKGDFFACGGSGGYVRIYDTNETTLFIEPGILRSPQHEFIFKINVMALTFGVGHTSSRRLPSRLPSRRLRDKLSDVTMLAVGLENGSIRIIDLEKMDVYLVLEDHKRCITSLSFTIDGSLILASSSLDGSCKLWDLWDDGNMYRTIKDVATDGKSCYACAWSPDRKSLCLAAGPHNAVVWSNVTASVEGRLVGHKHCVISCDFSPDNSLIATASMDTSVIIWDRKSFQPIRQLWHMGYRPSLIYLGGANGHHVKKVAFSCDNIRLATVCDDRSVRVWDLDSGSQTESEVKYTTQMFGIQGVQFTDTSFSPDGTTLVMSYSGPEESSICTVSSHVLSPGLMHLCRSSIRRRMSSEEIFGTGLPGIIKKFLCYEHNAIQPTR